MKSKIQIVFFSLVCASCSSQEHPPYATMNELQREVVLHSTAPTTITRNIVQDQSDHLWFAAFDGVFRYDGHSFEHMTKDVSSARFFSVLEDKDSHLWFGSIGAGVFRYDGNSFENFTTDDGLINNELVCLYQDRHGLIWLGANGGMSSYDGTAFRNYLLEADTLSEDTTGRIIPNMQRPPNGVNSIVEDQEGNLWIGTNGHTYVYNGRTFLTLTHQGQAFTNTRSIVADRMGRIWIGGTSGFWRLEDDAFTCITQDFVGYIYEDRKGNVWTSAQNREDQRWALSRYEAATLSDHKPKVMAIKSARPVNEGMIFGNVEARNGSIWFGGLDGAHRFDGSKLVHFKHRE